MKELLEEIVAADPSAKLEDAEAQQHFHALEFPAQHGSTVMKYLATHFQSLADMGFAHLKRMKKHPEQKNALIALVTPVVDTESDGFTTTASNERLAPTTSEMEQLFQGRMSSVFVLKRAPKTREAWETHTKAWPLIFHASVLPVAQAEPIEEREALQMAHHVRAAVALAKQFDGSTVGATAEESLPFCCAHGCVIVDPLAKQKQIVADSFANREHASYAFQALFHPVMIAIDGVAARDRLRNREVPTQTKKKQKREEESDADVEALDSEEEHGDIEEEEESYLCTGYDVYLDREPCAMCAMALIHSRARRVVFATLNPSDGALASALRLHTIKSLNHRYRVFHLRLDDDDGEAPAQGDEASTSMKQSISSLS